MPVATTRCDSCGTVADHDDEYCPVCGYPLDRLKEDTFLQTSLHDLQRVARYGGANITVSQLIARYQRRLAYLS